MADLPLSVSASSATRADRRSMRSMVRPYWLITALTRCSCSGVILRLSKVTMWRASPWPSAQCW
ncbi:hypothetical protein D3C77_618360 [compost metagenome]